MFSISELACASSRGSALTSTEAFGISSAACFSSASATRALMHFFRICAVSMTSLEGGNGGRSLCGIDGSNGIGAKSPFLSTRIDTFEANVDAIDTSTSSIQNQAPPRQVSARRRCDRQVASMCRSSSKISTHQVQRVDVIDRSASYVENQTDCRHVKDQLVDSIDRSGSYVENPSVFNR